MRSKSVKFSILALALAFATLCTTAVLAYREWVQRQVLLAVNDSVHSALSLNDALLLQLQDAETGQRGYLLTGRLDYLRPYNFALLQIPSIREDLREVASRDPELRRLLPHLEAAIDDKLGELKRTIDLERSGKSSSAVDVVQTDFGRKTMDRIRTISRVIHTGQDDRWQAARAELDDLALRTFLETFGGTLLLVALIGGAGITLNRSASKMEHLVHQLGRAKLTAERNRDFLQATLYSIGDAVITTDSNGAVHMINSVAQKLTGYSKEEAQGQSIEQIFRILNETTRAVLENPVRRVLKEGSLVASAHQTVLITKTGGEVPVDDSGAPITDADGSVIGAVLVFRDVSERRTAEEAALRLAAIVEGSSDAIVAKTLDGVVTSWNRGAEDLFGYSAAEMIGTDVAQIIPPDCKDQALHILKTIGSGESIRRLETARLTKAGCRIQVWLTVSPIRNREGSIVGAAKIVRDVTRERQLEEMLRQTQKMEAIGRLAGGVAHDFNNLLTVILGYADVLKEKLGSDSEAGSDLREIVRAGEHAASLTGQLLAFSRRQVVQAHVQDLNALVRESQSMLVRLIGEDVDCSVLLDPSSCLTKVDSGQVTQVLMNLALNARDAMPLGGKLTIETHLIDWQGDEIEPSGIRAAGQYILLAVTDSGCGMSAEQQAHIFEPFYTTKEAGKGTGLGLATVYGIVQQHGGWIDVYSEPGSGATFKIYFPSARGGPENQRSDAIERPAPRMATILIVEDQAPIRKLAETVLASAGHRVLSAEDGPSALRLASLYQDPIDLLLTDIVMPEMSGPELAVQLSRSRPAMAVAFMSGYTDHALLHQGVLEKGTAFIQKPFRAEGLLAKIDELLSPDPLATDQDAAA